MKKFKVLLALICFAMIATMAPLASHAAQYGDESANNVNVYETADLVTLTGTLSHYAGFNEAMVSLSQWLVLDDVPTGELDEFDLPITEEVTVYGLGPICYWDKMGVPRPEITIALTIDALKVTYGSGEFRYIAVTVVKPAYIILVGGEIEYVEGVDDSSITLRSVADDGTYGLPIWMSMNQSKQDSNEGVGGGQYNQ